MQENGETGRVGTCFSCPLINELSTMDKRLCAEQCVWKVTEEFPFPGTKLSPYYAH